MNDTLRLLGLIVACSPLACGSAADAGAGRASDSGGAGGSGTTAGGGSGMGGGFLGIGTGSAPAAGDAGEAASGCVATSAGEATFEPVRLAFAFDVSGSMGKLDFPWHDPTLKWDPVIAATKSFFDDPASAGISASMTFFPIDADSEDRCKEGSYDAPDVPFTGLPSSAFGDAIDAIAPRSTSDWRGGTPTLAVMQGTITVIQADARAVPDARHALVLVSDGYPQGCDDNSIDSVTREVEAIRGSVATYVIGVSNPPSGPDTVSNLDQIAVAGGTQQAFIIETGDPEKTKDSFQAAVRSIRSASVSCTFKIPAPPTGQVFDPDRANVTYASDASARELAYDPACERPDAWRYDDATTPTAMELCDATCKTAQSDPSVVLRVEFGCARRTVIR